MQGDLFEEAKPASHPASPEALYELSIDAYYAALYARMSELPIEGEIERFINKVLEAGRSFTDIRKAEVRAAAERAATDRGDPDVLAVLRAAGKVQHEIHRLTGLLRFKPDSLGVYTARCSPDHFILPALTEHFTLRFGETPWAIIDEKRKLCLCRLDAQPQPQMRPQALQHAGSSGPPPTRPVTAPSGPPPAQSADAPSVPEPARLVPLSSFSSPSPGEEAEKDSWEELWKLYHRSVNNEGKKNLRLQRQFMPERYRKYLNEI